MKFRIDDKVRVSLPSLSLTFPDAGTVARIRKGEFQPYGVTFGGNGMLYCFTARELEKVQGEQHERD